MYLSTGFEEIGRGNQDEHFGSGPGDRERSCVSVDPRQASWASLQSQHFHKMAMDTYAQ